MGWKWRNEPLALRDAEAEVADREVRENGYNEWRSGRMITAAP